PTPSNHRSKGDVATYLRTNGLLGIEGLDTRALTRHLRSRGAMMGIVSTTDGDETRLREKLRGSPGMAGRDLRPAVTCHAPPRGAGEGALGGAPGGGGGGKRTEVERGPPFGPVERPGRRPDRRDRLRDQALDAALPRRARRARDRRPRDDDRGRDPRAQARRRA